MNLSTRKDPIKILHLLQDKDKRFILFENLVDGLERENFNQMVCFLMGDPASEISLQDRYPVVCLGKRKLRSFNPAVIFEIMRLIREHGIDIVHCQRHKPTVYGVLGAWAAGGTTRVATTVHGRNRTRNLGRKLLNHILFKRVSQIIAVSEAVREDILESNRGLASHKVITVYNGIDPSRFSVKTSNREIARNKIGITQKGGVVFGTVGRLAPVKGQIFLIEAFEEALKDYPDSLLVFAGTGPLENELKNRAKELITAGRVHFLGYREDIPDVLGAMDCFVLPSLSEGHPLSLLEAMACRRMVIASRVGGIPEILSRPDLGIMTTPGSVTSLAHAINRVCRMDQNELADRGAKLRNMVLENYTIEKMVSATAEIYRSIILNESGHEITRKNTKY